MARTMRADHLLEVGLGDAVHLEGLPGGGAQGAVADPIGQIIEGEEEGGRYAAGGGAQPQHHLPVLLFPLAAVVPVVLLVAAVELEDLNRRLGEVGPVVAEFGGQGLAQVVTAGLEGLETAGGGGLVEPAVAGDVL